MGFPLLSCQDLGNGTFIVSWDDPDGGPAGGQGVLKFRLK